MMKSHLFVGALALALVAGCASTQISNEKNNVNGRRLARPDRILVYDFAGTYADMPTEDRVGVEAPSTPPTAEQVQAGRALGVEVARQLTEKINDMGLKAVHAAPNTIPRPGDMLIRGSFQSVEEGSAAKRLVVGFGSGSAELKTVVHVYQSTATGLRELGSGTVDSAGGKGPGMAVPAAVMIATANPIGLIVGGAVKAEGEISGRTKIEGAAKRTTDAVAERLKAAFEKQGWI